MSAGGILGDILGAAGGIGSLVSGILGSNASGKAASTQAQAANNAAQLQYQASQNALNFGQNVFNAQQQNIAPWLQSGSGALNSLNFLLGINPGPPPAQIGQASAPATGTASGGGRDPIRLGGTTVPANPLNPFGQLDGGLGGFGNPIFSGGLPGLGGGGDLGPGDFGSAQPLSRMAVQNRSIPGFRTGDGGGGFNPRGGIPFNPGTNMAGIIPARLPPQPGGINDAAGSMGGNGFDPTPKDPTAPLGSPSNPLPVSGLPGQTTVQGTGPGGFGSLLQGYQPQFQAPTNVTEQNDPGYQFRLNQGQKLLENSAASRGGLLNGGTGKALQQFGQDYASNEYGNVYNRALGEYQQNYNIFQNDQANQFNRLSTLAGLGQTAAGQLNSAGNFAANNVSSNLLSSAGAIGQQLNNAAAARGSGYVGSANALGAGIQGGIGSLAGLIGLIPGLKGNGGSTDPNFDPSICWIAEALWGKDDPRTHLVRAWLNQSFRYHPIGRFVVKAYEMFGKQVAKMVKKSSIVRRFFEPIFGLALTKAIAWTNSLWELPNRESRKSRVMNWEYEW